MQSKADDESGLSPGEEDNEAMRKKDRKDSKVLDWKQYKQSKQVTPNS